jgi:carboxymethylenebutenolidase
MVNLDASNTVLDLQATANALRARPEVDGNVGAVGYCMGGRLAFALAATGALDAAVCYYGGRIQENLAVAPAITVPILFHYAERDQHIPLTAVDEVKAAFAGRSNAQFHVYPGADHGFNCWGRPMYHQRTAALARGRTLQWLAENMG